MKLAILASHPIQYLTPLLRELAQRTELVVYYGHKATARDQADAGFGVEFEWDGDILRGYTHEFLDNRAPKPNITSFYGCDTPGVAEVLARRRPDILVGMGWHMKCYLQAVRAARKQGVPVFVRSDSHLHTPRSVAKTMLKRWLYPRFLNLFDGFLPVGTLSREYLLAYGIAADRCFVVPHVVDPELFSSCTNSPDAGEDRQRLGLGAKDTVLLFVGKFLPGKRPLDVLDAAAELKRGGRSVSVLMIGAGPLEPVIRERAQTSGVCVKILGFKNQRELAPLYRLADLLVLPSASETWGMVVNEALACGTPAIVSDAVGCAPDLIESDSTGAVFNTGDARDLARKVDAFIPKLDTESITEAVNRRACGFTPEQAATSMLGDLDAYLRARRQARAAVGVW